MKRGFTLLEVLIVASIVAILGAIFYYSVAQSPLLPTVSTTMEATYPEPTNYAVDAANILTPQQLVDLNMQLRSASTAGREIAIAIVDTTAPLTIEQYGIALAEKWKVGEDELDNGAIIILAAQDRKVRIEVGYGLEGKLPDSVTGRIIDEYMLKELKAGEWYHALSAGIIGIVDYTNK